MSLPDGIVLRTAVPGDAEALTALHLDCWDDAYTGLIPQHLLDQRREDVPARIQQWCDILDAGGTTWLADRPDGLVGFASAGTGRDNDLGGDIDLELMALYVRAGWWDTGVGYALLRESIADRAAYLWVLKGNDRAVRFYERQGFALDGTEDEQDEGLHVRMVRAGT